MAKTTMTREEEIRTLQSLKGDTYFGQIFDDNAIDQMCDNIKNDFGIECGVDILEKSKRVEKAESITRSLQHVNNDLQDDKDKLIALLFAAIRGDASTEYAEKQLQCIIGIKDVVVYKMKYEVDLNKEEREFIINNLLNA